MLHKHSTDYHADEAKNCYHHRPMINQLDKEYLHILQKAKEADSK
jgi:hypothetical protein